MIGNLQESITCGLTQEVKVYVQTPYKLEALAIVANQVLESTLKEASYILVNTDDSLKKFNPSLYKASSKAFIFVSGTGLDLMLEYYHLEYDPNEIRHQFFTMFKVKT